MPRVMITTESIFRTDGPHLDMLAKAGFEVDYPPTPELVTASDTIAALANAEAVIAGGDLYSEEVFAKLPRLRVVSRMGVGYDRIDVPAATRHRVAITITPAGNHEGVAEHAIALLLAVARSLVSNDRDVREGRWLKPRLIPLRGKTLGLVGLGRIGRSVASRAAALRMTVIACDPVADEAATRQLGIQLVSFEELLQRADFVSVHAPLNDSTRGLMSKKVFSQMRKGSILINTARGGLVVEADLLEALESGHLTGAGLDVLGAEPPPASHPLFALPNVVITSHTAGSDTQAIYDMAAGSAQNIIDLYQGRWPADSLVNPEVRDVWSWNR